MFEPINISQNDFPEIRFNPRARRISLRINSRGEVRLVAPPKCPPRTIEKFIAASRPWLSKKLSALKGMKRLAVAPRDRNRHFLEHRKHARTVLAEKILKWSSVLSVHSTGLSIRNQKSRWGSCSREGRISLNYKLMFLPDELCEYVVAHELCHLKELNHSKKFWAHVAEVFPNYRTLRKKLGTYQLD